MKVSFVIKGTKQASHGVKKAEGIFLEAFEVGRFRAQTVAMQLAMPFVPRASGFLRSTAYVTRGGRLGFSAEYAAVIHELSTQFGTTGPFFLRRPLSEQRDVIGQAWALATRAAVRGRQTLEGAPALFPETPPPGVPPPRRMRIGGRTSGRRRRAA